MIGHSVKGRSDVRTSERRKPHEMSDAEIRGAICLNAQCRGCECLDKCQWGKQAIRRGLANRMTVPSNVGRPKQQKPEKQPRPEREQERKTPHGVPVLEVQPVGMVDKFELMEILGITEGTLCRYRSAYGLREDAVIYTGRCGRPMALYWPTMAMERIAAGMTRSACSAIQRTMDGKRIIEMRERLDCWLETMEEKCEKGGKTSADADVRPGDGAADRDPDRGRCAS